MAKTSRFDLSGKVSLVTGAGAGIGRAFCEALAEHGSDVVCADIKEDRAQETADIIAKHGVKTLVVKVDVSKQDEVKALFKKTDQKFGKLDVLFNNAGIVTAASRLHETSIEDWNRLLGVNLTGVFLCMQEGVKLMLRQKSGSIINISSIMGLVSPGPTFPPVYNYVAAKHGVIGLTKQAAVEYASDNIRVNAIAPGFIGETKSNEANEATEEQRQQFAKGVTENTPMRRFGTPGELQGLGVWLASDASSFVTGATLVADGGWSAW
jgi:NAD(P)-dependent dehydrogenase (short-subunit alcohol dehydrogenase family)